MSTLMLDTCGLIWLVNGEGRLSMQTLDGIQKADIVYVSAASALEIGCKAVLGKLELPLPADEWYARALDIHDLVEIPVSGDIALLSATLPLYHRDPADRIIIATAIQKNTPVVTHDSRFEQYGVTVKQ